MSTEKNKKEAAKEAAAKQKAPKTDPKDAKIKELTDKLAAEHDDYVRLMAEFETFRRRTAEEKLSLVGTASADTVKEMLPVLDACEKALEMLADDSAAKEGTELIYSKLMECLKKRGLSVVDAKGEKFDADKHEAIAQIPAPSENLKGVVLDVTRTGYSLGGKIIRYPQVVVGA